MSFAFPLALLGFIGIPVVILIYILQSKYNEQIISSTYIWKLSDRFLKRKNPLSGLTGLISLILQILLVTVITLLLARPMFNLPGGANEYYFVLDASSSMTMEDGKETRFDAAKDEIVRVIKRSTQGSTYTLACVSGDSELIFVSLTNKTTAIDMVKELEAQDTSATHLDLLQQAQEHFDDNPSGLIYVVTDKSYASCENAELIYVGSDATNYAVSSPVFSLSGGTLNAAATLTSYGGDADLRVRFSVDGQVKEEKIVGVKANEPTAVSFACAATRFSGYTIEIVTDDDYARDNTSAAYNLKSDKTYSTLIVSDAGFFLESVIDALLDSDVTTVTPEEYEAGIDEAYGLYIFDSYEPVELPDGAVWLINADASIPDSGFGVRGKIDLGTATEIEKSASTATSVRKLLTGVDGKGINIINYVKYSGMYLPFHTLFSVDSNPVIFAGANALGNRQVVIGFDLHESDFVLSSDFVLLTRNLLAYSFPDVLEKTSYTVGEEAAVNVLPNVQNLKAIAPSGKEIFIDDTNPTAYLMLNEIGTYTVTMSLAGTESRYQIYSSANPAESAPVQNESDFKVEGEREYSRIDGQFDPTVILFIALAVLFIADWGLFCYDKYQLR